MKKTAIWACLALLSGCSATTLRCGVDGETSYVDLVNFPQDLTNSTRDLAELCGFAYQPDAEPTAELRILDST